MWQKGVFIDIQEGRKVFNKDALVGQMPRLLAASFSPQPNCACTNTSRTSQAAAVLMRSSGGADVPEHDEW